MEEDEEEEEMLYRARLKYKEIKCDAIAKSEDDKRLYLVLYVDGIRKMFEIALDGTGAKSVKNWCEEYLGKQEHIEGYV